MITACGDIDLAVNALKEGAADFIIKPWHNTRLLSTIRERVEKSAAPKPKLVVKTTSAPTAYWVNRL